MKILSPEPQDSLEHFSPETTRGAAAFVLPVLFFGKMQMPHRKRERLAIVCHRPTQQPGILLQQRFHHMLFASRHLHSYRDRLCPCCGPLFLGQGGIQRSVDVNEQPRWQDILCRLFRSCKTISPSAQWQGCMEERERWKNNIDTM